MAWATVVAGAATPLVRKRLRRHLRPVALQACAYAAPVALCIALPRSRRRDVAVCALNMWAYLGAYEAPNDDPERLRKRTHVQYPIVVDRLLGGGELPTVRLQRALARGGNGNPEWRALDRVLVWAHWLWFMVPHSAMALILWRRPQAFTRSAVTMYATYNIGACLYWLVPTAPPWFAAMLARGEEIDGSDPADISARAIRAAAPQSAAVRRMMVEYGESFWREGWGPLYGTLGGNPFAAMPSMHCATSLMAALQLREISPLAGAIGGAYAGTLSFALVYLGEHYLVDLLAGTALTLAVYRHGERAQPLLSGLGRAVSAVERSARGRGTVLYKVK